MAAVPKVSVVMVVRNPHPRYFRQAVDSILDQSFTDFEFVIVEGTSEHSGKGMLSESQLQRIQYHVASDASLIERRNMAIGYATGEYVAIMDGDDICHPTRLEQQIRFLDEQQSVTMVGCQIAAIDPEDRVIGFRRFPTDHSGITTALRTQIPFCQPSVMVRRMFLVEVGGYRDIGYRTGEDYELWCRMWKAGATFGNLNELLLCYRIHKNQMKFVQVQDTLEVRAQVRKLQGWSDSPWLLRLQEQVLRLLPGGLLYRLAVRRLYSDPSPDSEIKVGSRLNWNCAPTVMSEK